MALDFPVFPDGSLESFATIGAVDDRSVRLWLREGSAAVKTAVLRTEGGQEATAELCPDLNHDRIAVADLVLAQPEPEAAFAVTVAGQTRKGFLGCARDGRAHFTFGFGSCHEPLERSRSDELERSARGSIYDGMVRTLHAEGARFLALLGDQVYADEVPHLSVWDLAKGRQGEALELYRHIYRGYYQERGLRRLLEEFPSYMIWDDHEIMDNWGAWRDQVEPRWVFDAASRAYTEYQHVHNPGTSLEDSPPFGYSFWHGDVGFLILDMRSFRSYREGRVLDEAQWEGIRRFLDEAAARDAPTLFIGVTVPMVHFPPALVRTVVGLPGKRSADARGRWNANGFRGERFRLLDLLFDWQSGAEGRQVIMLSGDVHAAASFRVRRKHGLGELRQWTSSSVSSPVGAKTRFANRLLTRFAGLGDTQCTVEREAIETFNNFGVVHVAPRAEGPGHEVTFRLFSQRDRGAEPALRFVSVARA